MDEPYGSTGTLLDARPIGGVEGRTSSEDPGSSWEWCSFLVAHKVLLLFDREYSFSTHEMDSVKVE